jgi:hypothetical protein
MSESIALKPFFIAFSCSGTLLTRLNPTIFLLGTKRKGSNWDIPRARPVLSFAEGTPRAPSSELFFLCAFARDIPSSGCGSGAG